MRKLIYICILFIAVLHLACDDGKITDAFAYTGILELTEYEINCTEDSIAKSIEVKGGVKWDIDTSETAKWCQLLKVEEYNLRSFISIYVSPNFSADTRETSFRVFADKQNKVITVRQLGNSPVILMSADTLFSGKQEIMLFANVLSNVGFDITNQSDWFTAELKKIDNITSRVILRLPENNSGKDRIGSVLLYNNEYNLETKLVVVQNKDRLEYSSVGENEVDGNYRLEIISASATNETSGKDIGKSFDDDEITHFQSGVNHINEPIELEYVLNSEHSLSYIKYVAFSGDLDKSFKNVDIYVQQSGLDYELNQSVTLSKTTTSYITFAEPIKNVEKVKFVVKSVNGSDKNYLEANCAEMHFYSSDALYSNIFVDQTYSELLPGVTMEDIYDIENAFFRNLAIYLYRGEYDEERIIMANPYSSSLSTGQGSNKYFGNVDNPTGISVEKDDQILVFVEETNKELLNLLLINPLEPKFTKKYRLLNGVNKIEMDRPGHLYLEYNTSTANAKPIKVHIAGGSINTVYRLGQSEPLVLDRGQSDYIDIQGEKSHLLFRKEDLQNCPSVDALIAKYDEIVKLHYDFAGFTKYNKVTDHRMAFMAYDIFEGVEHEIVNNWILCPLYLMENLCDASKIKGEALWDISHKLAHNTCNACISFTGVSEHALDIFTLYVEDKLGLQKESVLKQKDLFFNAFNNILIPELILTKSKDDYYELPEKVVPFWQLYLYFTKVLGNEDFYPDFNEQCRTRISGTEAYFLSHLSKMINVNLKDYFKAWGFVNTIGVKPNAVPAGLKYITNDNWELYKNPVTPIVGSYKVAGTIIAISGCSNVVAYKVKHEYLPTQVFLTNTIILEEYKSSMTVYAVGANGEEVLIPKQ